MPLNAGPDEFAAAEGEGDRTYRYWREVYEQFFKAELAEIGREFSDNMILVCERF